MHFISLSSPPLVSCLSLPCQLSNEGKNDQTIVLIKTTAYVIVLEEIIFLASVSPVTCITFTYES